MREIKFRAWNEKEKKMIPHNRLFRLDTSNELPFLPLLEKYNDDYQVMQFTGLKDRNGKEIYEGDIVDTNGGRGEVIWNEELAAWGVKQMVSDHTWIDRLCDWTDEEVIGNIYENPDYLTDE